MNRMSVECDSSTPSHKTQPAKLPTRESLMSNLPSTSYIQATRSIRAPSNPTKKRPNSQFPELHLTPTSCSPSSHPSHPSCPSFLHQKNIFSCISPPVCGPLEPHLQNLRGKRLPWLAGAGAAQAADSVRAVRMLAALGRFSPLVGGVSAV